MHAALMLASLDEQSLATLRILGKKALYAQEIQLIRLGRLRPLALSDVWQLPERFRFSTIQREFVYNVDEPMFLLRAIVRLTWRPMIPLLALEMLAELADIFEVVASGYLLSCFDASSDYPWYYGYCAALGFMVARFICSQQGLISHHRKVEVKRAACAIQLELFRLPLIRNGQRMFGQTSMDPWRIGNLVYCMSTASSTIADIVGFSAKFGALYYIVGWLAVIPMMSSVVIMLARWGFKRLVGDSFEWESNTDVFDSNVSEVYQGIKAIKLFGWERMYLDPKLRQRNYTNNDKLPWYAPAIRVAWFLLDAAYCASFSAASFLLFSIYTQRQTAATAVWTSAEIFQLDSHVSNVCSSVERIVSNVSDIRRELSYFVTIERALRGKPRNTLPRENSESSESHPMLELNGSNFTWNEHSRVPVLKCVSLGVAPGELVAVTGKTGSGKSSLLLSICGELAMTEGTGKAVGSIAYLEQSPWIMNDTMRANVLFGREYDAELFAKIIHACALTDDMARWPHADLTVIGERGINISGGQRARLALARTLYS
ncbi:hypothetical protein LPJ61_006053, partial [Coemansia biformis]